MESINDSIKSIIFDLGGVLLNIDYSKTIKAFADLGLPNPEDAFSKEVQAELFQKLEKGQISNEEFINTLQTRMQDVTETEITTAWCALLEDFPLSRYELLQSLSKRYRLFLLSNTNSIHEEAFKKIIDEAIGWDNFDRLFEAICYSHDLQARKPDAEIFEKVLALYGLKPSETLFVDDTLVHAESALKLGIMAVHLQPGKDVLELF